MRKADAGTAKFELNPRCPAGFQSASAPGRYTCAHKPCLLYLMEGRRFPVLSLSCPRPTMQRSLPAEILDEIFDVIELDCDWHTLSSCTLVCRFGWHSLASRRLFRRLRFHAATAYSPGYTGRREKLATFRDFLTFVRTCERAPAYTRSLTLLGWISSGYHGPHSTGPIRTAKLSLDVLIDILTKLPSLRELEIISISICPPSILFAPPPKPAFVLEKLRLNYRAPYRSALYLAPSMSFNLPDVVSLFSSIDELVLEHVPQMEPTVRNTFKLPSATQGGTHVKTAVIHGSGFDETNYFISAFSKMFAPKCLFNLDVRCEDNFHQAGPISPSSLDDLLEGPGIHLRSLVLEINTNPRVDQGLTSIISSVCIHFAYFR